MVNDVEDMLSALNYGSSIRQTDSTAINARSSRSHAVFSLSLVQKKRRSVGSTGKKDYNRRWTISGMEAVNGEQGDEATVTISSKLHFVDLAGSERLKYIFYEIVSYMQEHWCSRRARKGGYCNQCWPRCSREGYLTALSTYWTWWSYIISRLQTNENPLRFSWRKCDHIYDCLHHSCRIPSQRNLKHCSGKDLMKYWLISVRTTCQGNPVTSSDPRSP